MSVWADIQDRSMGDLVKKEDIKKGFVSFKMEGARNFRSYMNIKNQGGLRYHNFWMKFYDDRWVNLFWYHRSYIITPLGNSGKKDLEQMLKKLLQKYEYVDGYACEDMPSGRGWHKAVMTEKNRNIKKEFLKMVDEYNKNMMINQ